MVNLVRRGSLEQPLDAEIRKHIHGKLHDDRTDFLVDEVAIFSRRVLKDVLLYVAAADLVANEFSDVADHVLR